MANISLSVEELLERFARGETLKFKPTRLLSSKGGHLELTPDGFTIYGGTFGIKKTKSYEWAHLEEFGINSLRNTGKLSFVVQYEHNHMVGFNLKPEYAQSGLHKFAKGMGKFMGAIGQDNQKYVHGAFYDSYGFKNEDFLAFLNGCLEIYNQKQNQG